MTDVLGQAIADYYHNKRNSKLWIHNKYGVKEEMPVGIYFRSVDEMPDMELIALQQCDGKILDIGAGAGSHVLLLQEKDYDITALEISAHAAEVMKLRGVKNIIAADVFEFKEEKYDTLLMLMNGIGFCGTIEKFRLFLQHAKGLLNEGGQIVFDSSDVAYLYDGKAMPKDNYYGEIEYQYEYRKQKSEWFRWLYIDQDTMIQTAAAEGWSAEVLTEDEFEQYLVKLTRK